MLVYTEVIAERDAQIIQIAAALLEVVKNQPHLQMMVQTGTARCFLTSRRELMIQCEMSRVTIMEARASHFRAQMLSVFTSRH